MAKKKGYTPEDDESEVEAPEEKSFFEKAKEKISDVVHHPIEEIKKEVSKVRGEVPGIESHPKFNKFKKGSK